MNNLCSVVRFNVKEGLKVSLLMLEKRLRVQMQNFVN